jgi:hypothetical protein
MHANASVRPSPTHLRAHISRAATQHLVAFNFNSARASAKSWANKTHAGGG